MGNVLEFTDRKARSRASGPADETDDELEWGDLEEDGSCEAEDSLDSDLGEFMQDHQVARGEYGDD